MTTPHDGGPAFPVHTALELHQGLSGMSLRAWLAGMAMQGMLVNGFMPNQATKNLGKSPYNYASAAVEMADALISELEKEGQ